jgi:hypothetical protein
LKKRKIRTKKKRGEVLESSNGHPWIIFILREVKNSFTLDIHACNIMEGLCRAEEEKEQKKALSIFLSICSLMNAGSA